MLTSTLLPLALAGAVSMASASPIQYAGRAPSVVDVDGLQREFKQSVERSVAQLSARSPEKDEDCTTHRSRKVKKALSKSAFTLPLKNPRDWEYLASVKVGTPQQNIDLMVDTGSADLLIPRLTDTCGEADGCESHFSSIWQLASAYALTITGFNSTRSRTFNKLKEETRVFTCEFCDFLRYLRESTDFSSRFQSDKARSKAESLATRSSSDLVVPSSSKNWVCFSSPAFL